MDNHDITLTTPYGVGLSVKFMFQALSLTQGCLCGLAMIIAEYHAHKLHYNKYYTDCTWFYVLWR